MINVNKEKNYVKTKKYMWQEYSATYWSCRDCGALKIKEVGDKFPIIHNELPDEEEKIK